jgi:hypothetical protein
LVKDFVVYGFREIKCQRQERKNNRNNEKTNQKNFGNTDRLGPFVPKTNAGVNTESNNASPDYGADPTYHLQMRDSIGVTSPISRLV